MTAISMTAASRPGSTGSGLVPFALKTTVVNNAANQSTFTDESQSGVAITVTGTDWGHSSMSPYRAPVGYWSLQFNTASNDQAFFGPTGAGTLLQTGTGDFTYEFWIMREAGTASIVANTANSVRVLQFATPITAITSALLAYSGTAFDYALRPNRWTHVAWVRISGTMSLYVDGKLMNRATGNTTSYDFGTQQSTFGAAAEASANNAFIGRISNWRICIGEGVYTGDVFTPPTSPLTVRSSTKLLTLCGPAARDYSGNNVQFRLAATLFGHRMIPASPFGQEFDYVPATHGGSIYCGPNTRMSAPAVPAMAVGTGDFTLSFWVYIPPQGAIQSGGRVIFGPWNSAATTTSGSSMFAVTQPTGAAPYNWIRFVANNSGSLATLGAAANYGLKQGSWCFMAFVRQSGTLRIYCDGIQVLSQAFTVNFSAAAPIGIFGPADTGASNLFTVGNIAELQFIPGVAKYTAAFNPPTSPQTVDAAAVFAYGFSQHRAANVFDATGGHAVLLTGAKVSTDTSVDSTASVKYTATTDKVQVPGIWNSLLAFNPNPGAAGGNPTQPGDFTYEAWVNFSNADGTAFVIMDARTAANTGWALIRDTANKLSFFNNSDATAVASSAGTMTTKNTWTHVAVVRSYGTLRLYINGQVAYIGAYDASLAVSGANLWLGNEYNSNTKTLTGYMQYAQVSKYAKYTSESFTPPTKLAA